jgi:hypothetical protein
MSIECDHDVLMSVGCLRTAVVSGCLRNLDDVQ